MGLRATSVIKYEIEYGNHSGFNYDPDTLGAIIDDYCDDFYSGEDYHDTNVIWEINKDQFKDMVSELEDMTEEEFNARMEESWGNGDEAYTKKYVVGLLKGFLDDTPTKSEYVRIGWL